MFTKIIKEKIFPVLLLMASAFAGYYLLWSAYESFKPLGQYASVTQSKVGALLPGEAKVVAEVAIYRETLKSAYTTTPSVYYRYTEEVKEIDSEGNTRWNVVDSKVEHVDFYIIDNTGKALVNRSTKKTRWSVPLSYQEEKDNRRYTEWRIEPGDTVAVSAVAALLENQLIMSFALTTQHLPLITKSPLSVQNIDVGALTIVKLWSGIALLSLCTYFYAYVLRIHRTVSYLILLTLTHTILFIYLGLSMLKDDMVSNLYRYDLQRAAAVERVEYLLQTADLSFYGWHDLHELSDKRYVSLDKKNKEKIDEIRLNLLMARALITEKMQTLPGKWFIGVWELELPEIIPSPAITNNEFEIRLANHRPEELLKFWPGVFVISGWLFAFAFLWLAMRQLKVKRYLENVSTASAAEVEYGLSEIKGKLVFVENSSAMISPLTGSECAWYYYHVEEKRGSGKSEKWVTVKEISESICFYCKYENGCVQVKANKAEVISGHIKRELKGAFRYTEKILCLNDELYISGYASVSKTDNNSLVIAYSSMNEPYIISNESEKKVMIKKARMGMLSLSACFSSVVVSVCLMFAMTGGFSSADLFMTALVVPVLMLIIMLVLRYKDIVFLQQRINRDWSKIQLSLMRRYNIVPNIERMFREYAKSDKDLYKSATEYRVVLLNAIKDKSELQKFMAKHTSMVMSVKNLYESCADLKNSKMALEMKYRISSLENELMLMERSYNGMVEKYNVRIKSMPDIALATLFGLTEKEFILK